MLKYKSENPPFLIKKFNNPGHPRVDDALRYTKLRMRHFVLAMALAFVNSLHAQPAWNFTVELPYALVEITDMVVDDNQLIVYGDALNNNVELKQGLVVAKLDTFGNVTHQIFIQDALGDKLAVTESWGKIVSTSDGGYLATAATVTRKSAFLIKLSSTLNIEFIREYPDSINLSNFDYRVKEVQGGYLLFGSIQIPDYSVQGFVKYVDYAGNILWERFYANSPYKTRVMDLDEMNDSTFIFGTVELLTPHIINVVGEARSGIYVINLQGDLLQSLQTDAMPEMGYLRKIIALEDGAFITYGISRKKIIGTVQFFQPTFTGYNASFLKQWGYNIGNILQSETYNTFYNFTKTFDGNIVGAGGYTAKNGIEPSRGHGWVYKFSPDGDSLWSRSFPSPFPDFYPNGGLLFGIGQLSSGSLVAAGTATDEQNNPHCWVVKLTNDGCMDTLFCQTVAALEAPALQAGEDVSVFPNPARQHLHISAASAIKTVQLYDPLGRMLQQYEIAHSTDFDLLLPAGCPPGVYQLVFYGVDGLLRRKGVCVEGR